VLFWDQEAVAREDRAVIEERQRYFVLKHQTSRHLAGDDLTKKAGRVIQGLISGGYGQMERRPNLASI
jgi:hypothetical protein